MRRNPNTRRYWLVVVLVGSVLAPLSESESLPLYSVDSDLDKLVVVETESGAVTVIGTFPVDIDTPRLVWADTELYLLNRFFNDHVDLLTIDPTDASVLSSVPVTHNGTPIVNAEGFTFFDGNLMIGFSTSGSISNSNAIGVVAPSGEITVLADYSQLDPQADADGIIRAPDGRLLWTDIEYPGSGDFLRVFEWTLPPEPTLDLLKETTPLVAVGDLVFLGAELWSIDSLELRLVRLDASNGCVVEFIPHDSPNALRGLARVDGTVGIEGSSWTRVKALYRSQHSGNKSLSRARRDRW